jgi:hypothetical protein
MRTRDYALGLSMIVFLLVGIGVTLLQQGFVLPTGLSAAVFVANPSDAPVTASVSSEVEISREERIASLRKKIAALGTLESEPSPEAEQVAASSTAAATVAVSEIVENRCAAYAPFGGVWDSRKILMSEAEGARIVYRETESPSAASGTAPVAAKTKQILMELPVKSLPPASSHCIPTDVVGITTNGTLLRNDERIAYGSFDAGTLIGYALDGFPIYGSSNTQTDTCGGVVVGGQYRYYLHPERTTMISCFAGKPINL